LRATQADSAPQDHTVGEDELTGPEVDSGFGETVPEEIERRAIPRGGMNDLAEK